MVGVKRYGDGLMKENDITGDAAGKYCLAINHRLEICNCERGVL